MLKKSSKIFLFFKHDLWSENNIQGILWIVLNCFLTSLMISIVRHLSKDLHVFQVVMMRNFFALLFFLPYIIKSKAGIFHTKKLSLHIYRNLSGLIGMFTWFYAVTAIPLAEAVSITFITPILTTLAAMIFLKEQVDKKSWIALIVGFTGVLIVIRPGFKEFNFAYIFAFVTTFIWCTTAILVKKMSGTEKPQTVVVYTSFMIFFLSIPISVPYLKIMTLENLFWLAVLGIISNLAHISMTISYSKVNLSIIQPFDFSRLIFTSIIAYFAFGEIIDIWTVLGSIIIIFGSIYFHPKPKTGLFSKIKKIFNKKPLPPQLGIEI